MAKRLQDFNGNRKRGNLSDLWGDHQARRLAQRTAEVLKETAYDAAGPVEPSDKNSRPSADPIKLAGAFNEPSGEGGESDLA